MIMIFTQRKHEERHAILYMAWIIVQDTSWYLETWFHSSSVQPGIHRNSLYQGKTMPLDIDAVLPCILPADYQRITLFGYTASLYSTVNTMLSVKWPSFSSVLIVKSGIVLGHPETANFYHRYKHVQGKRDCVIWCPLTHTILFEYILFLLGHFTDNIVQIQHFSLK